MYRYSVDNAVIYTSEDIVLFRESPFASWMERLTLENPDHGILPDEHSRPPGPGMQPQDELAAVLRVENKNVELIDWDAEESERRSATLRAMHRGVDFIVNGQLALGPLSGAANLLMRTSGYSELGTYLYVPCDTQAKTTLNSAFRLCFLADLLHSLQGQLPPQMLIIRGGSDIVPLKTEDHIYHYRAVKQRFMRAMSEFRKHRMPDPAESAHFGRWSDCAHEVLKQRALRAEGAGLADGESLEDVPEPPPTERLFRLQTMAAPSGGARIFSPLRLEGQLEGFLLDDVEQVTQANAQAAEMAAAPPPAQLSTPEPEGGEVPLQEDAPAEPPPAQHLNPEPESAKVPLQEDALAEPPPAQRSNPEPESAKVPLQEDAPAEPPLAQPATVEFEADGEALHVAPVPAGPPPAQLAPVDSWIPEEGFPAQPVPGVTLLTESASPPPSELTPSAPEAAEASYVDAGSTEDRADPEWPVPAAGDADERPSGLPSSHPLDSQGFTREPPIPEPEAGWPEPSSGPHLSTAGQEFEVDCIDDSDYMPPVDSSSPGDWGAPGVGLPPVGLGTCAAQSGQSEPPLPGPIPTRPFSSSLITGDGLDEDE